MLITQQKIPLHFDMNVNIIISNVENVKYLEVVLETRNPGTRT